MSGHNHATAAIRVPFGQAIRVLAIAGLATVASGTQADAQETDRWVADEAQALATLPLPSNNPGMTGAELSCAAQRWTLALQFAEGAKMQGGPAIVAVDGQAFDVEAKVAEGALSMPVPREALIPLKDGLRLQLDLPGEDFDDIIFALRGSRVAIGSAEQRCTLRDMTGYTPVTFTPFSSYMNLARELRAGDIKAFAASTASEPVVSAAMVDIGEGKRLFFTRLCGSSWYYGSSGCNITGFAPAVGEGDAGDGWRAVYDTENVHLYTDPRSLHDGWPDIATLPTAVDGEARLWRWEDDGYALQGDLPDEPEDAPELRGGLD